MIIWINGAFGAGKTQTAFELHRRTEHTFVYDPENAGYFIRKNIPEQLGKDDFQDFPMWREHNYSMLSCLNREYDGTIIVPMTLVNPQYFDEIIGKLRADGVTVHHFALCASKEVIGRRLKSRGDGADSWAAKQTDRCVNGLADKRFQVHMDTDRMTIEDNVAFIAERVGLRLNRYRRSAIGRKVDRIKTQLKHIRFFK